ncbi:hypothetical protein G5V57_27905 [Nordella sp. HKS 07]|uniref:hypothetical protein n=1 Tax=Nordella sp. HKS 07 TaxID=2712222 RepID=UPI0013E1AE46|nr:hypothetical protein [Nordella sp. HKS 07]QIG51210.1 hypothetical protein G5V57_27905 [Nordella sp. HKS 07]
MLFKSAILDGIRRGSITLAFRRWPRPRIKAGSEVRTALGVVAVTGIKPIEVQAISEADARKAGYATKAQLLAELAKFGSGSVFRIGLGFAGKDPREALRKQAPTRSGATEIATRLARLDTSARDGAWTLKVLELIAAHPAVRAAELAAALSWETQAFKIRVRKLKELGLTESLETGYRISPRGAAYLKAAPR